MLEDYILRHKSSALMYLITRYLKFYLMVITVDHSTFPIIYRITKKEETNSSLAFGDHYLTLLEYPELVGSPCMISFKVFFSRFYKITSD